MIAVPSPAEPDGAPRLASLDVLRGVAILGILFMNINDMGGSLWASFVDIRHMGWGPADRVAWWLREVLANGTARGLLEMLFGAGLVILTDRYAAGGVEEGQVLRRYAGRNLVLLLFGVAHLLLLLWPGDILHTYALAALVAMLFRAQPPRLLIACGLFYAIVQLSAAPGMQADRQLRLDGRTLAARAVEGAVLAPFERQRLAAADEAEANWRADERRNAAIIATEDRARGGPDATFATWAGMQWQAAAVAQVKGFEWEFVWEAASTMLIGAALFRLGLLAGGSRRRAAAMALAGYAVGVPLRIVGAWAITRFDGLPHWSGATDEVARLAMTIGHIGLILSLLTTTIGANMLRPFAAAGRTALTIYIAQTLICLWLLFPPFGLALYGRLTWAPLMAVALAIDALLLAAAMWWTRHFRIAPVEWAWRSLVERRALRWR
ncbi:MAG: DUF418 domain-containing protein [Sphingomonas fennica]